MTERSSLPAPGGPLDRARRRRIESLRYLDVCLNLEIRECKLLNETFKALADPTRRDILRLLSGGDLPAGEIAATFDISAPSVSHHLSVLKQAGLVTPRREGQSIIYSLNSTVVQEFLQELLEFFKVGEETDA